MTLNECYRQLVGYDVAMMRHDLYGEPLPTGNPYRELALLYELRGEYRKSAQITIESMTKGIKDPTAKNRLERLRRKYGYETAERKI